MTDPNQPQPLPFARAISRAISRELDASHNHAVEQAAQLCEAAAVNRHYLIHHALLSVARNIRETLAKK